MTPALRVLDAGPGVTLQDSGRHGHLRHGVTVAGPMDPLAFATANIALGNAAEWAAVEVSIGGVVLSADGGPIMVAVAGGDFRISLDGRSLPSAVAQRLETGATLAIRSGRSGAWAYVAVAGRFDIPMMLGSLATHLRSGFGGLAGKALAKGDLIPVSPGREPAIGAGEIDAPWLARSASPIRVILGPQEDYFSADTIETFFRQTFRIGNRSDRMAYQLEGAKLTHAKGFNIVSDGIAMGAIQVPGEGSPFVLMADRQPTGGYPKIANVITADLGRFAQLRPGDPLQFASVSLDEAVEALRRQKHWLQQPARRKPLVRELDSEALLALNLIDGVTAGE